MAGFSADWAQVPEPEMVLLVGLRQRPYS